MSFLDALGNGSLDVRADWPAEVPVVEKFPAGAYLADPRFEVGWYVCMSALAMDLSPAHDATLRGDTERFVRGVFASRTPCTHAPDWSPIVDFAAVDLGGTRALLCVHRTAYEPTNEVVSGELLIPLSEGTFNVSVYAGADTTGVREAVLAVDKIRANADPTAPGFLRQGEIDDPELDSKFPDTPLARVRRALRWRLAPPGIEVLKHAAEPQAADQPVVLRRAGCTIVAPPRYVPCAAVSRMMSPTLDALTRVAPPGTTARMLDVWRVESEPPRGWLRKRKLKSLATDSVRQWQSEGVTNIELSPVEASEREGRLQVDFSVRFIAGGETTQSVQRWFLDGHGHVHRICAGGPPSVPVAELAADVEQAAQTWQPI